MVKIKNEAKKVSIESIDVDGFSFLMYLWILKLAMIINNMAICQKTK